MTSTYRPTADSPPSVSIDPGAHAAAGHTALLRVHVRNLADATREMTLTLLGLDGEWLPAPSRTPAVAPDATITVELAVPVGAGAVPGCYPFALAVEAHEPTAAGSLPRGRTMLEGALRVDAPSSVMLSVEPAESEARLGRKVAVVLSNSGEQPVPLTLDSHADKGLRIQLDTDPITLPPRATVRLPARLSVTRPQVVGHRNRMSYALVARGDQAPARFHGTLTSRPMVGATMMRALAMIVVIAVWAAGVGIGVPWLSQQLTTTEQAQPEDVVAVDEGAGADEGGDEGGSGSGSNDGSDGGEGADGDVAEAAQGVRIGGLVTSAEPAGVRVDIAPASVLEQQTLPAAPTEVSRTVDPAASDPADGTETADPGSTAAVSGVAGGAGRVGTAVFAGSGRAAALPATSTSEDAPLGKVPAEALTIVPTDVLGAERSTSTQEDGTWAFAGLSPTSNYLITLSKPGYQTQRFVMSGEEAAAAALEVELVAGSGRLSGMVTGPDGPAGGVDLTITDGTNTVTTSTNTSGNIGAWAVEGLSTPSTYLVTAAGEGLGAQSALIELSAGGQQQVDLELRSSVTTLTGTVSGPNSLGADGGLGGLNVTVTDGTTTRTASTVTDSAQAGTYVLPDLPVPGSYTVTVSGEGYAAQSRKVELATGSAAPTVDLGLTLSSGVVDGVLRDPEGNGLGSAGLTLRNDEHTYKTMTTSASEDEAGTDSMRNDAGRFRFNGIEPGEYVLQAEVFGYLTGYAEITVKAGGVAHAELVLTPVPGDEGLLDTSRIRGRASDARTGGQISCGALAEGEECQLTVTMTAQGADGTTRHIEATADPDLEYTIPGPDEPGLLPGLYTLTVSAPGYEPGEVSVQVPMDRTVSAGQVALYPSPSIVGTVLARGGTVPDGTCVIAAPSGTDLDNIGECLTGGPADDPTCTLDGGSGDGELARCAATGTNGSYAIEQLSSGQYDVVVVPPASGEYLPVAPVTLSLEPGDVRRYDATIDRLGRVALSVLSDAGSSSLTPAPNAEVVPVRVLPGGGEEAQAPLSTDADGRVLISRLVAGDYRFDVTWAVAAGETTVDVRGSTKVITVGHNQELTDQLVLTRQQNAFESRIVTNLGAGGVQGATDVTVRVNGIIGYNGLVPVWGTAEVITDSTGHFRVAPEAGSPGGRPTAVLELASDQVNVEVTGAGYEPYAQSNVHVSDLVDTPIELDPRGQEFTGSLVLAGAPADVDLSELELQVEQAPPGAEGASIDLGPRRPDGSYDLVWNDLRQPAAETDGTLIRPGRYRISGALDGYDSGNASFTVNVGEAGPTVELNLARYGQLSVAVRAEHPGDTEARDVPDPVVTLVRPSQGNITTPAMPGTNAVDFGEMPSGTYTVRVQAAGYGFEDFPVTVAPGQTDPVEVLLEPMGVISGTVSVQTSAGSSRAMADVEVRAEKDGEVFTATTDSAGYYRITGSTTRQGLGHGDWKVTVTLDGYSMLFSEEQLGQLHHLVPIPEEGNKDESLNIPLVANPVDLHVDIYDPVSGEAVDDDLQVRLHTPAGTVSPCWTTPAEGAPCLPPGPDDEVPAGRYSFLGIDPGSYTLDVTGGNYAPLMVTVNVAAGVPTQQVNLPIAARTNTIMGTVSGQAGAAAAAPIVDPPADVGLWTPDGSTLVDEVEATGGAFTFAGVPDGTYLLQVDHTAYTGTSRSVHVQGGQVLSIDIVLYTDARQVSVTVESAQGFDLTGALVALEPDPDGDASGQPALAPQPVVRSGPKTFTTTFNQVPPGAWTASVSGPAGHYGTFSASLASGAETVTVPVDEMRVRLAATSGAAAAPTTLDVDVSREASPSALLGSELLDVGAPAVVIYLERGDTGDPGYVLEALPPEGWTATPVTKTIAADAAQDSATFDLTEVLVETATTVSAEPAEVDQGDTVELTATVRAANSGEDDPTSGTVHFSRDGGATSFGSDSLVADGTATVTVTDIDWAAGEHTITATYEAGEGFEGSHGTATVEVWVPTETTTSVSPTSVTEGQTVTFTVDVTPTVDAVPAAVPAEAGTIMIYRRVAGPGDEPVGTAVAAPSGSVQWTAQTGDHTFYAVFTPATSSWYRTSTSDRTDEITVAAEDEEP